MCNCEDCIHFCTIKGDSSGINGFDPDEYYCEEGIELFEDGEAEDCEYYDEPERVSEAEAIRDRMDYWGDYLYECQRDERD